MNELDIANEWLRYANNDLIVAKHCFEDLYPKQTEIASYHCQQCAEKALKAYLSYIKIEFEKTHDLKLLNKLCQDNDSSFAQIMIQCAHLNPYGVAVRYPNELSPNEDMVKLAIVKAQEVYDFCADKIAPVTDVETQENK